MESGSESRKYIVYNQVKSKIPIHSTNLLIIIGYWIIAGCDIVRTKHEQC